MAPPGGTTCCLIDGGTEHVEAACNKVAHWWVLYNVANRKLFLFVALCFGGRVYFRSRKSDV